MKPVNIQQLLDNPDVTGAVRLPCGEFEGPFNINRPCVVVGSNTTLWCKNGPILNINSNGVALRDLRVEVTNTNIYKNVSVATRAADTRFSNVEIIGGVTGVAGEDGEWYFPKVINLKKFPADRNNTFTMEIYVPVPVKIDCSIYDIKLSTNDLYPGKNTVTITTDKLRSGSYIYGEMLLVSSFSRRIYISGSADENVTAFTDGMSVYNATQEAQNKKYSEPYKASVQRTAQNNVQPQVNTQANSAVNNYASVSDIYIKRGQRVSVADVFGSENVEVSFIYDSLKIPMEIDPYVFLLNNDNKAVDNDKLVFFGNICSKSGEVQYFSDNGGKIVLNLPKATPDIDKIAVTYSIYGDNPNNNFSKIVSPKIVIKSPGGAKMIFCPDDLMIETTIVGLEFYRHNNSWKLSAVGSGYRNGLKRLCESFGLNVL